MKSISTPTRPPVIDGYLGAAAAWAKRHGIAPEHVLMGEFGALRKDARYFGARAADRARYVRDVREAPKRSGFPGRSGACSTAWA